ncbi:hypothetical protein GCM10010987_35590 [Bradyrhizobium guangdongense]|uniref:3-isopropylmalate dehydratase n=1 Tax=Bradyrhizobium guangdongense TaxID=1325090 RepID=A0AA87W4Q9_9BRAD|nr:hypothetical protein GCM10010987_35590 [Bradyrhizobium guangdongense]
MEKFVTLEGVAAVLADPNIDTDAIIPARFMRSANANLGKALFANSRFQDDGSERADFVLNIPPFRSSSILVAGDNFGCGSSREAAVWALKQFGIRCVIARASGKYSSRTASRMAFFRSHCPKPTMSKS